MSPSLPTKPHLRKQLTHWLSLIGISTMLFLSGCAAATYSKAQRAFSQGTELRNLQEAGVDFAATGTGLADLYDFSGSLPAGSAEEQFEAAKAQLDKALKNKVKLRKDGLLANAHLLLGLTEFQLGNYEQALEQAAAARTIFNEDDSDLGPDGGRDFALSYALNPIVSVTQLYDSIKLLAKLPAVVLPDSNATTLQIADFYDRRMDGNDGELENALNALDFAIQKATNSPETVRYLRNYQMAALLNTRVLLDKFLIAGQQSGTFRRQGEALQSQFRQAESRLNELSEQYRKALLSASQNGENDPFYRFWKGKVF